MCISKSNGKWLFCGAVLVAFLTAGCAASKTAGIADEPLAPQTGTGNQAANSRPGPGPSTAGEGSLWRDKGGLGPLFVNAKARQVGDIVTVNIVESSRATNKATTKTGRNSSVSGGLTNFFNMEQGYPSDRPFFNPFSSVTAGLQSDFDGSGTTARSGALNAYMTARIVEILPNGNLCIQGNREVRVNNENQVITLTGLVRPRDISADNVVRSTYIADARITYSGTGSVNDRQQPGWLMRILDKVWPF
jgi:flagellar L-ring protein precursor FlgH